MERYAGAVAALLAAVCLTVGCEGTAPTRLGESPRMDTATAGTIQGVVKLDGPAPEMHAIDFSSNPQCEREHPKPIKEQSVVVGPNGGISNTFVWIKSGLPNGKWEAPATPAKLDQAGCIYAPHVLGLMVGQELDVLNSDPVNHDVHLESRENEPSNDSEPPRSNTVHRRFVHQEVWFPVSCGVHPWMRSYVAVVGHPFFAVTGADGSYRFNGVPAGKYVLETVHEKYGRQERVVTLGPKEVKSADFGYGKILR